MVALTSRRIAATDAGAATKPHPTVRGISRARFVSQMGNEVSLLAFPLLLISQEGAKTVPLLYAAEYLPFLLLAPLVGQLADSFEWLKLMAIADAARLTIGLLVVLGAHEGVLRPWMVVAGLAVAGAFTALDEACGQSAVARAAGPAALRQAMSRMQAALSLAGMAGPAVGAVVISAFRPTGGILLDSLTYGASAVLVLSTLMRARSSSPAADAAGAGNDGRAAGAERPARARKRIFGPEAAAGLRYVLVHRDLRALLILGTGLAAFSALGYGVLIVYLAQSLRLSTVSIGCVMVATAAGAFLGGRSATGVIGRLGDGTAAVLMLGTVCVCVAVAPLASAGIAGAAMVAASRLGAGFAMSVWRVVASTARQRSTPDDLRGRVEAAMGASLYGALPLGYLGGAALLHVADPRVALWTAVIGFAAVVVLAAPGLRAALNEPSPVSSAPLASSAAPMSAAAPAAPVSPSSATRPSTTTAEEEK